MDIVIRGKQTDCEQFKKEFDKGKKDYVPIFARWHINTSWKTTPGGIILSFNSRPALIFNRSKSAQMLIFSAIMAELPKNNLSCDWPFDVPKEKALSALSEVQKTL